MRRGDGVNVNNLYLNCKTHDTEGVAASAPRQTLKQFNQGLKPSNESWSMQNLNVWVERMVGRCGGKGGGQKTKMNRERQTI